MRALKPWEVKERTKNWETALAWAGAGPALDVMAVADGKPVYMISSPTTIPEEVMDKEIEWEAWENQPGYDESLRPWNY